MDQPVVTDNRRIRDDKVGEAAKVSTSTLKPKNQAKAKKAKKQRKSGDDAAIAAVLEGQGYEETAPVIDLESRKARKPPKKAPEPDKAENPLEGLEPIEDDNAWCCICGRMLYESPGGPVDAEGHGAPEPQFSWEQAAKLLYDLGLTAAQAAERMEVQDAEVAEYFEELDGTDPRATTPPEPELEPEPEEPAEEPTAEEQLASLDPATLAGARESFKNGASLEKVARFYGKAVPMEVLEYLHATLAPKKPYEPPAIEETRPAAAEDLPNVQAAMGGHGMHAPLLPDPPAEAAPQMPPLPPPAPAAAPSGVDWAALQAVAPPLSAAEYERLGRLWLGALIAGVDIQTYARREREVLRAVRGDILGRAH